MIRPLITVVFTAVLIHGSQQDTCSDLEACYWAQTMRTFSFTSQRNNKWSTYKNYVCEGGSLNCTYRSEGCSNTTAIGQVKAARRMREAMCEKPGIFDWVKDSRCNGNRTIKKALLKNYDDNIKNLNTYLHNTTKTDAQKCAAVKTAKDNITNKVDTTCDTASALVVALSWKYLIQETFQFCLDGHHIHENDGLPILPSLSASDYSFVL